MPGMSERKSDIVFSAIIALGMAVPVCIGVLESRPAAWEGEIVFEKVERETPTTFRRIVGGRTRWVSWEELGMKRP